jgi:hypothetical protein
VTSADASLHRVAAANEPAECAECGTSLVAGQFEVQGCVLCTSCAAFRACTILAPDGSARVSVQDIEHACDVLRVASSILKAERLSRFTGVLGPVTEGERC